MLIMPQPSVIGSDFCQAAFYVWNRQGNVQTMKWNLPNILTLLRLLAAPMVAVMFLYFTRPYADWFALILFLSAAITDWFDGYLARAWKQETKLGAMLDPIADKLLVAAALLLLAADETIAGISLFAAVIILSREILVSGLREYLASLQVSVPVTQLAKWKTAIEMLGIGGLLLAMGAGLAWLWSVSLVALWLAAVLAVYTLGLYVGALIAESKRPHS